MKEFVKFNCLRLNEDALLIDQVVDNEDTGWEIRAPKEIVLHPGLNVIDSGVALQMEVLGFDFEGFMREPHNHKHAQMVHTTKAMLDYMFKNQFRPWIQIRDKSGRASQDLSIKAGIVDKQYTGEICVMIRNNSKEPIHIKKGDKITQVIPMLTPIAYVEDATSFTKTNRGDGKMGSTGVAL